MSRLASADRDMDVTASGCVSARPGTGGIDHNFTTPSAPEVNSCVLCGWNATPVTALAWAGVAAICLPSPAFHRNTLLSAVPAATVAPLGASDTALTAAAGPVSAFARAALANVETRTVLSAPAVSTVLPSGERATARTASVCAVSGRGAWAGSCQNLIVP